MKGSNEARAATETVTRWLSAILLGVVCVAVSPISESAVLFDTAAPPMSTSGVLINDGIWVFHRFPVSSPVTLTSVGGTFANYSADPVDVFGAIVALSGPDDFPDSLDLSSSDVMATNLITLAPTPGAGGAAFENALSLPLDPGWYALEFGTGAFGASNVATTGVVTGMPEHLVDLAPVQFVVSSFQPGFPALSQGFVGQATAARFFATAVPAVQVTAGQGVVGVPEPGSDILLLLGLALAAAAFPRRSTARRDSAGRIRRAR